ncbi:Glutathione S-transferase 2 [Marasmius crinis-equi]|uniref:Glutathione S-transferase 2 n=1 Tax=Marasmius crinis-equi TaxID=585013 RepID=A0ABR3F9R2_9AGAR
MTAIKASTRRRHLPTITSTEMSQSKITLYSYPTPNGVPISSFLEELGVPYTVVKMSIFDKDRGKVHNHVKEPWFLDINLNARMPAITHDGFNVIETSAILLYLAAEFDKERRFSYHPVEEAREYSVMLQWLFFAHGGIGPMQGQAGHFLNVAPEKIPYAQKRYLDEVKRLYSVLETRLSRTEWLAGDKYTIADIKTHGWIRRAEYSFKFDFVEWPNLKKWLDRIEARPAVQKGVNIPPV